MTVIQERINARRKNKHLSRVDLRDNAGEEEARQVDIIKYPAVKINIPRQLCSARNAIGVELLVGEVISSIRMGQEENVRIICLCGVEGIGKTVAAAVIFERICLNFECFVFLNEIGEADQVGILGLQKKLLRNLKKVERWRTNDDIQTDINKINSNDDIQTNINKINSNMCRKRIFLVLDNVTSKEQIDYFGAGERDLLCCGSRILITTRSQNLLKDLDVDDKYIVKGLDRNEALQLFCRHAWKREEPQEGYEELSRSLAHYAGGNPSSLKRLGSYLHGKSEHQWRQTLEKLVKCPYLDSLFRSFWSVGPYGGQGDDAFDDGAHTGVRQIRLYGQSIIESMTIDYDQNGSLVRSHQHGTHVHGIERVSFLPL